MLKHTCTGRRLGVACIFAASASAGAALAQHHSVPAYPIDPYDPSTTVVIPQVAPPYPYPYPYPYPRPRHDETVVVRPRADRSSQLVSCSSHDQRYVRCEVQLSHRDTVYLTQQESRAPCRQGRDWGQDSGAIWVANGCRATFTIDRYYWR